MALTDIRLNQTQTQLSPPPKKKKILSSVTYSRSIQYRDTEISLRCNNVFAFLRCLGKLVKTVISITVITQTDYDDWVLCKTQTNYDGWVLC